MSTSFEGIKDRKVARATKVALATAAMFGAPASAEAQTANAESAHYLSPAAQIKNKIVNHKSVGFDADHGVVWGGSEDQSFETTVPLVATVDGEKEYFRLSQTGQSLRSLRVTRILPTFNVIDENFSSLNDPNATPSTRGVISINTPGHEPAVHVRYSDGETVFASAGHTAPNQN